MKAQMHEKLRRFGVTGPGREWLLRALHPASEDKSPGLPDQSAAAVLRPDFRVQATIQAPPDTASWDCLIWTPPGDVNAVYWATGPAGTDFNLVNAPSLDVQVGVLRLQRSTQSTQATSFQTYNDITVESDDCLTQVGAITNAGFRHQFKSITIHQIAAAVSDQGQVYAAQFAPNFTAPGLMIPAGYNSGVPDPRHPETNLKLYGELYSTVLPTNESDMAAMSPDFYMGPSREGIYLPMRLSGPSQPFARAKPHSTAFKAENGTTVFGGDITPFVNGAILQPTANVLEGTANAYPWPYRAVQVSTQVGLIVDGTPATVQLPQGIALDSGYDNINIGVVLFRGLQGGGGGGFATALQVKCIAGLEIIPNPGASDRVFAEEAAAYDPKALQAYYTLAMELKDVYPARYNGWGDIWDAIKSAASSVWDVVKPAVKEAVPVLVDAGMGALTRGLGGMALTGAHRGRARLAGPGMTAPLVTYRTGSEARSTASKRSVVKAKRSTRRAGKSRA